MNTNAERSPTQLNTGQLNTGQLTSGQRDSKQRDAGAPDTEQPDAEHRDAAASGPTNAGPTSASPTASSTAEADQETIGSRRARFEIAAMERAPREKQWTIPPQADKGAVTITLRLPEVQVDDSGGRHIRIGPEQADVLGSRLIGIRDWLQEGHDDWVGDDDPER